MWSFQASLTLNAISDFSSKIYDQTIGQLPEKHQIFPVLFFTILTFLSYILFVFYSSKILARKNILQLDLGKYNQLSHPIMRRLAAVSLYIIEYAVISPAFIIVWFYIAASFFFGLLNVDTQVILFMATVLLATIRGVTYINEGMARDVSKVVLIGFIVFFLLNPIQDVFLTFSQIKQLSSLAPDIFYYIIFILLFEFVLRLVYVIYITIKGDNIDVNFYVDEPQKVFKHSN